MGYETHLWRMLEPLGVYRGDGFSGGELAALGTGMDRLRATLEELLREMTVVTAEKTGLVLGETLFPVVASQYTENRRENLKALYQTDYESFSKGALEETLSACGIPVVLSETGNAFTVMAALRMPLTMEQDPVWVFQTLERVLPSHLMVMVYYNYADAETGLTLTGQQNLKVLREMTQSQWGDLLEA